MTAAEWTIRPADEHDREGLVTMLGVAYTRTRAGQRAGASRAGGSVIPPGHPVPDDVMRAKQNAFIAAHRPLWLWLLDHAEVSLVVDPEKPTIIWGWLLTSGPDVVHAVGVKRSFTDRHPGEEQLAVALVTDLLGVRLQKHQVATLELPQLRTRGSGSIGIDRPQCWSMDPTWLLTRMVGR